MIAAKSIAELAARLEIMCPIAARHGVQISDGNTTVQPLPPPPVPHSITPPQRKWPPMTKVGAGVMVGSMAFVAFLIVMDASGHGVGKHGPALVALFAAMSMSVGSACIAGSAEASGMLPVPKFFQGHPVRFAVTGGFAAFVIAFYLVFWAMSHT